MTSQFKIRFLIRLCLLLAVVTICVYFFKFEMLIQESPVVTKDKNLERLQQQKGIEPNEISTNCHNFFQEMIDLNQTTFYSNYVYNPITEDEFITSKKQQLFRDLKMHNDDLIGEKQLQDWKKEYTQHVKVGISVNNSLKNQTVSTRVFNQCFIKHHETFHEVELCGKSEKILFPWLQKSNSNECLIKKIVHESKPARAIVITIHDGHFKYLIPLFITLRALGNVVPIEIIHRGDLSTEIQQKLQTAARTQISRNINAFKSIFEHENYQKTSIIDEKFPPLDVEFKNIKGYLSPSFERMFKKFSNKVLATLFSSYEEIMLMDADVIPFIPPQNFFELEEYKKTGAFFFRDRELFDKSSDYDRFFWKEMNPTETEQQFFGINSQKTKHENNRYMKGFTHYLESGVVMLNRKKHFGSILHSTQFQLWDTTINRVWGDKEFFWISMMINGDDEFSVNEYAAGTFGEFVDGVIGLDNFQACAIQPVHLYCDKLLWVNSGIRTCKSVDSTLRDKQILGSDSSLRVDLMTEYKSAVYISNVVIPPNLDSYYLQKSELKDDQKTRSWLNMPICASLQYCAKARVKLGDFIHQGKVVQFDEQQIIDYNFIGVIWISAIKIMLEIEGTNEQV